MKSNNSCTQQVGIWEFGTTSNRAVCQVEDCKTDLSNAKDYHRRHKVCDMHSKATEALVGSVLQRFCQQCSRFLLFINLLQEFDEGKRSCRRRLAGHNRRRRKAHPDTAVNGGSLNNESGSSYLLISLLRILSNMHSSSSDQTKDQDVVSHLLRSLANVAGTADGRNISTLLQGSQGLFDSGTSVQTALKVLDMNAGVNTEDPLRSKGHCPILPASRDSSESKSVTPEAASRRFQLNDIDLNNTYDDSQDYVENLGNSHVPASPGTASLGFPSWMQRDSHKSSPPQTSGNSDLTLRVAPVGLLAWKDWRMDSAVIAVVVEDSDEILMMEFIKEKEANSISCNC
ncbi:squamosa promoter-binding-like protein 12 [Pyrus x bretschneideri]|uniref:squamosa promoter-binding-like protein 12 n=1 Tax=Pyrus x bretschneideri TaxID=225117 RepID=UPI00202F6381|nr:squamosa promoter-binding-like protein 12 [Pyrus x bretschneideri]